MNRSLTICGTLLLLFLASAPVFGQGVGRVSLVGVWTSGEDLTEIYTREGSWIRIEQGGNIFIGNYERRGRSLIVRYSAPGEHRETVIVSEIEWSRDRSSIAITSKTVNGMAAGLRQEWQRKTD